MEDNVGRTRQGRLSKAHLSARKELATNAPPPKRGCRGRQGPPVRGTHDAKVGGSRSRARPPVPDDDDDGDFDAGEYLNELADYDEEPQTPQPQPQQQSQQPKVEEEGYGEEDRYLCCVASTKKVINLQKPHPDVAWFGGPVIASGLEPLVRTNFNVLDCGILWSFAERWHPETSTFHLPLGEMGITLDDVQCLLHLPIEGKFLNHRKMTRKEGAEMVSSFLGVDEDDASIMFATLNGSHLKHSYVAGFFSQYRTAADRAEAENRPVHEISSAALVHLQHYLDDASEAATSQISKRKYIKCTMNMA
ncbi:hypothetical protein TSUD_242950 [Trifolium subterraneum]|uniref:Aminotransferase-like plant mobile domain-containing protein n=1 Tax=Trifolium subterraneum TaxID=3900 RepID=A0A2Z6PQI3_TRISU|nr:hypothetical protein TSUD_242950 [Trifolium subterraneum]